MAKKFFLAVEVEASNREEAGEKLPSYPLVLVHSIVELGEKLPPTIHVTKEQLRDAVLTVGGWKEAFAKGTAPECGRFADQVIEEARKYSRGEVVGKEAGQYIGEAEARHLLENAIGRQASQ